MDDPEWDFSGIALGQETFEGQFPRLNLFFQSMPEGFILLGGKEKPDETIPKDDISLLGQSCLRLGRYSHSLVNECR
jgi:hypothetical protein